MEDTAIIQRLCDAKFEGVVLKDKQMESLLYLMTKERRDLLINLPVGYGKSLIYQLFPFAYSDKFSPKACSLVMSPLNIIQTGQLQYLSDRGIPACRLDMSGAVHCNVCQSHVCNCTIQDVAFGKFSVVYCHPESIFSSENGQYLLHSEFSNVVRGVFIDECHVFDKWHKEFRKDYGKLKELPAIFERAHFVAVSGTLTKAQLHSTPIQLGLESPKVISESPDRPNIYLEKKMKIKSNDSLSVYEDVFKQECEALKANPTGYPVTLMFIPMYYMSCAIMYLRSLFGEQEIYETCYSAIFSHQDEAVIKETLKDLFLETPKIRLILSTSVTGMGFDPPSITRVIHACPPRSLSQYLQEIGRAGRRGQPSHAILCYGKGDIAKNLAGISQDIIEYCNHEGCLRDKLLSVFGFNVDNNLSKCNCCSFCRQHCDCQLCNVEFASMEI